MTTTATYLSDLNRVRVAFSAMDAAADYAKVERSIDGFNWKTVRGGETVPVTAGAGQLDDYEFTPGVLTTYRVTAVDSANPTFIAVGTSATANNASVSPGLPAGVAAGDAMVLVASIRNSGAGTVNTPAGWTALASSGNLAVFGRVYQAGDTAPTVTFAGGVVNADTMAKITAFRNTGITVNMVATQLNSSAQNIATPAASSIGTRSVTLALGWKQDDWSAVAVVPLFTHASEVQSTAGDDAAMIIDYRLVTTGPSSYGASSFTVTGGVSAISRAIMLDLPVRPFTNQETATITPTFTQVWIKNLQRPYMNTALATPVGQLLIERDARAGLFPIVGRSVPVAVTDLRLGKAFTLGARVESAVERDRLDLILSAGEPILLHIPPGIIRLKSMYAIIGKTSFDDEASILWMPLTEAAAPPSTIVGSTVLWSDIIATYATWSAVIAANATWADVLNRVGDPTDIITG